MVVRRVLLGRIENHSAPLRFIPPPPLQPNVNLYGAHPLYVALEHSGYSHGIYLHNSNFIGKQLCKLFPGSGTLVNALHDVNN